MSKPRKKSQKRGTDGLGWERTPPPAAPFEQAFEILASRNQKRFTVDAPESSQAKTSHAMPLFALSKERFDPHTALAIGFLVGFGSRVVSDPIQHLLIDTTAETSPLLAGDTLRFERADIAAPGIGAIAP